MQKTNKFQVLAMASLFLLAACGEVEDSRPGQPVKTRQTAFKEIIKTFEPMGVMLREKRYDADKFLALATQLVERREAPWAHFGPDTNYPPTKATDKVWREPEQFERERQAFFVATDALLVAAQRKDKAPTQVESAYQAVYETCQNCHKPFKSR